MRQPWINKVFFFFFFFFCYTAVFCVVTQRSAPQGALRDDTKKRLLCVADYRKIPKISPSM